MQINGLSSEAQRFWDENLAFYRRELERKKKAKNEPPFQEKVDFICRALGCPESEILSLYVFKIEAMYSWLKEITKIRRVG